MHSLLADSAVRTFWELEPLLPLSEWWQILLLLVIGIVAIGVIVMMYVLDSVELSPGLTTTLVTLRILAFIGLLVFFLNPTLRSEKQIVKNSRVPVLIDTSLSMGLRDAEETSGSASPSRIEQVVAELEQETLVRQLRRQHDVLVYRFDQNANPDEIATFPKIVRTSAAEQAAQMQPKESLRRSQTIAIAAGVVFVCSLFFGGVFLVVRSSGQSSWLLLASVLLLVGALVTMAVANLLSPDAKLMTILNLASEKEIPDEEADEATEENTDTDDDAKLPEAVDWNTVLNPRGTETRLGEALRYVVNKERGGPVAGVIVISDGRSNAGIDADAAVAVARDAKIPIYTVGMGGTSRPTNVRVADIEAPRRALPGDDFTITGLLQSHGLNRRRVKVQLVSKPDGEEDAAERFEEERSVDLIEDGKELAVAFEVTPQGEGRRIYSVRVEAPERDRDTTDNEKSALVEVINRPTRVMLLAGGPTREFQFLRNQLHRDKEVELDVLLQSSPTGISQEGNEIYEFPEIANELFEYDCIVAFDPDWRMLSKEQIDLLDRWVAEKAGGLIVVVGSVFTPEWTRTPRGDERMDTIRALYPVSFFSQGSVTIKLGRFAAEEPGPLFFTREGRSSEFLWIEETAAESEQAWNEFEGVYGYYAVNESKPGATVFARFTDPSLSSSREEDKPIYLAGHFYGAGRVFFQASGEMWRIRSLDETYFERYYTKLIRWASQGRLLRDSVRGVLLVDKDRCMLGDQVEVRAILTDAQHLPLTEEEVSASLFQPGSGSDTLILRRVKEGARDGTYAAQFTAIKEGDYEIRVAVPQSEELEFLTREVRVRVPDLEIERPQRNDALLSGMARTTGGIYFVGIDEAMNRGSGGRSLVGVIQPQDQTTYLPGTPNQNFSKVLMGWLLAIICSVLCMEWTIRRLSRLA